MLDKVFQTMGNIINECRCGNLIGKKIASLAIFQFFNYFADKIGFGVVYGTIGKGDADNGGWQTGGSDQFFGFVFGLTIPFKRIGRILFGVTPLLGAVENKIGGYMDKIFVIFGA